MKHRVIDPKGIHADGNHFAKGKVVDLPDGAALKAFLHFKQVAPVDEVAEKAKLEVPEDPAPAAPPTAEKSAPDAPSKDPKK
ncbi:MAG TPA: hypothetical protein VGE67_09090 [Haloferula sp.]